VVVDREDEAGAALLGRVGNADVEPDGRVEGRLLVDEQVGELLGEDPSVLVGREVAVLGAPAGDRVDHAAHELPDGGLTLRRVEGSTEVLLRNDVRGVLGPRERELDVTLLEGVAALLEVRDHRVAGLPLDLVEWVNPFGGEVAREGQTLPDDLDVPLADDHWTPPCLPLDVSDTPPGGSIGGQPVEPVWRVTPV
jgi:hypothetical protein